MTGPTFRRISLLLALAGGLTACSAHRIDVQQGNALSEDKVARLAEGMTREQVRFLLGTPMVPDTFRPDRWDYVFYHSTGERTETRQVTVFFQGDQVSRIEKNL